MILIFPGTCFLFFLSFSILQVQALKAYGSVVDSVMALTLQ
jgi:hypothetical protein